MIIFVYFTITIEPICSSAAFFSTDSTKHTNKASHNHFKIILRFPCYFGLSCLSPEMHLEDTHLCSNPFVPRFILTPHSSHYHCLMPHNIYTGICEMHKIIIKIWLKWIFPCLFVLFSISCIPAHIDTMHYVLKIEIMFILTYLIFIIEHICEYCL